MIPPLAAARVVEVVPGRVQEAVLMELQEDVGLVLMAALAAVQGHALRVAREDVLVNVQAPAHRDAQEAVFLTALATVLHVQVVARMPWQAQFQENNIKTLL